MAKEIRIPIVGDSSQLKRELAKAERELDGFGGNAKRIAQDFNREFLLLGAGIAAGLGLAVKASVDFDKQMSEVGAVAGASAEELDSLRDSAIEAGAATVFSASQAATAQAELAKAGVSTADILGGGLTGALDLASAGSIGLGDAAMYAANAMNTFGLSGSDVPRIADALAAGANKSAASVDDMGMALQQSGQVAAQTGLTLEETTGVLSLFAQAGLKGSDAGTSLKTALLRLNPTSKEAAGLMSDLGLSFYDNEGAFVGISVAAQKLQDKLGPLSDEQRTMALNTIFGTDAIRGATVLMNAGSGGVSKWTNAVSDSGYAADLAAQKTDNLAGDLEQLRGSLETALIQGGSQATTALRGVTSALTDVINGIGAMPAPLQTAFLGATGLIGVGSTAIGVYGTLAPKIDTLKKSLEAMGGIGPKVAANIGTIGLAAGGVTAALAIVAFGMGQAQQEAARLEEAAKKFADAMKDAGADAGGLDKAIRQAFAESNIGKYLKDVNTDLDVLTRGVRESGTELDRWRDLAGQGATGLKVMTTELEAAASGGDLFAKELLNLKSQMPTADFLNLVKGLDFMNDAVDTGAEDMEILNKFTGDLTDGTDEASKATSQFADEQLAAAQAAEDTAKALEKQYDAVLALAGGDVAYRQSQLRTREAVDDYNETLKDSKKTALERERAGQDLIDAFLSEASAAVGLASDMKEAAGEQLSAKEAADIQKTSLENLRDTLAPGNPLREQLQGYIDDLSEIPAEVNTTANLDTAPAILALSDLQYRYKNELDGKMYTATAQINARTSIFNDDGSYNLDNNPATPYASGGMVGDGWFTVGERGPELGRKRGSSVEIFSNAKSQQMVGGGDTWNVTVNGVSDPRLAVVELQRQRRKQVFLAGSR